MHSHTDICRTLNQGLRKSFRSCSRFIVSLIERHAEKSRLPSMTQFCGHLCQILSETALFLYIWWMKGSFRIFPTFGIQNSTQSFCKCCAAYRVGRAFILGWFHWQKQKTSLGMGGMGSRIFVRVAAGMCPLVLSVVERSAVTAGLVSHRPEPCGKGDWLRN